MSLQITCPSCKSNLVVDSSLLGKKIQCSACQTVISVAAKSSAPPLAKPVQPAAPRATQDFSALPAAPSSTANPYRYRPQKKPPSNKAILVTAIVGASALVTVIGLAVILHLLRGQPDSVADSDVEQTGSEVANTNELTDPPLFSQPWNESTPTIDKTESDKSSQSESKPNDSSMAVGKPHDPPPNSRSETSSLTLPSSTDPVASSAPSPNGKKKTSEPTRLSPSDDQGLQRVHLPEGYSVAVPSGFTAANRAINKSTAIYNLLWRDGVRLTFMITDDRSIAPDSPIPTVHPSTSRDGKRTVKPMFTSPGLNHSETYQLDGMHVSFVEVEQDVGHEDMTEQIQTMFSGAMTPEMKRQYAHLMQEKVGFQTTLVMKAMDDERSLEILVAAERPSRFDAPDLWMRILKSVQHQSPPDRSRIPRPFLYKYKN